MRTCVTCGAELHPERAKKYDYCMSPECQEKNLKGLTMVAVGVNKAAEQYLLLDEGTKADIASGKYHDQRRGSFGTTQPAPGTRATSGTKTSLQRTVQPRAARTGAATKARQPWTASQARLALLYNEQGQRPAEIAARLGLSTYAVTQIILAARNRGKL